MEIRKLSAESRTIIDRSDPNVSLVLFPGIVYYVKRQTPESLQKLRNHFSEQEVQIEESTATREITLIRNRDTGAILALLVSTSEDKEEKAAATSSSELDPDRFMSQENRAIFERHKWIIQIHSEGKKSYAQIGAKVSLPKSTAFDEVKKHEKKRCLCFASSV